MNELYNPTPLRLAIGMRQAGERQADKHDEAITIAIMKVVLTGTLLFSTLLLPVRATTFINPGFETGNFTGWQVHTGDSGHAYVVPSTTDLFDTIYTAPGGSHFAELSAGDTCTTISQTFTLTSGQTLSGWAAFLAQDFYPYNDDAIAQITVCDSDSTILSSKSALLLWSKNVLDAGDHGSSPWETWTFKAPRTGIYTLTYGVKNIGDNSASSEALFDTRVSSPVPDAGATAALLTMGLLGLAWMRRTVR